MGKDSNHRGATAPRTRFARLDHDMLRSAAYRALSPNARSLLVEFAMIYNTKNNGELYLSVRDAANRMGVADTTAATNAFAELEDLGFIAKTADAHFAVKAGAGSRARCWRLTWEAFGNAGATFDYRAAVIRGRRPAKRAKDGRQALDRHQKIKSPVLDSATQTARSVADYRTTPVIVAPSAPSIVRNSATLERGNPQITVKDRCPVIRHTYSYTTPSVADDAASSTSDTPPNANGNFSGAVLRPQLLDALREDLRFHVERGGYGAQKAIAEDAHVPAPVLSRFRSGHNLPAKYYAALRLVADRLDEGADRAVRKAVA